MILLASFILWLVLVLIIYNHVGWREIKDSYSMWWHKDYWRKRYNVVEAMAWSGKLFVILPAIFFQIEVWWAHIITLMTSSLLIWVSEQKLLPTLVAFNTIWIFISSFILIRYFFNL